MGGLSGDPCPTVPLPGCPHSRAGSFDLQGWAGIGAAKAGESRCRKQQRLLQRRNSLSQAQQPLQMLGQAGTRPHLSVGLALADITENNSLILPVAVALKSETNCFTRGASAFGVCRLNVSFSDIAFKYQQDLMGSERRSTEEFVLEGIF